MSDKRKRKPVEAAPMSTGSIWKPQPGEAIEGKIAEIDLQKTFSPKYGPKAAVKIDTKNGELWVTHVGAVSALKTLPVGCTVEVVAGNYSRNEKGNVIMPYEVFELED